MAKQHSLQCNWCPAEPHQENHIWHGQLQYSGSPYCVISYHLLYSVNQMAIENWQIRWKPISFDLSGHHTQWKSQTKIQKTSSHKYERTHWEPLRRTSWMGIRIKKSNPDTHYQLQILGILVYREIGYFRETWSC